MFYKEWRTIQLKFSLWMTLYTIIGLLLFGFWWLSGRRSTELFETWVVVNLVIVTPNAILGGIDLVAQERSNNTISFLLTRPISRGRVYLSKIAITIAGLTLATLLSSGVLLIIDQLFPTIFGHYDYDSCAPNCTISNLTPFVVEAVRSVDPVYALAGIGLSILLGAAVICLSGIVSIFFHNVMQALFVTLLVVGFIGYTGFQLGGGNYLNTRNEFFTINFTTATILAIATVVCVLLGTAVFRRREF